MDVGESIGGNGFRDGETRSSNNWSTWDMGFRIDDHSWEIDFKRPYLVHPNY